MVRVALPACRPVVVAKAVRWAGREAAAGVRAGEAAGEAWRGLQGRPAVEVKAARVVAAEAARAPLVAVGAVGQAEARAPARAVRGLAGRAQSLAAGTLQG